MKVLVQPPYFKILGSHNDKLAPSLLFLGTRMNARGEEVALVNADAGPSSHYIPWRQLYNNFEYYELAVLKGAPAIYEAFEKVMQYRPDEVILEAGDILEATVDIGSPFIALHLAELLKREGVKVYTIGPLWREGDFEIETWPEDILPLIPVDLALIPGDSKYDTVFTKVGCPYRCLFCLQPKYTGKWERVSTCIIESQLWQERHYIEDPVFDPDMEVVNLLKGRHYLCEARADRVCEDWIDRIKKCGVQIVKLGLESGSALFLEKTNKAITKDVARAAVGMLREADLKIVVYIMLGWYGVNENEHWEGLDFFRNLNADYYVVNITCTYGKGNRDWRFDTHFSPVTARFWGLSDKLVNAYFDLQDGKINPSLV